MYQIPDDDLVNEVLIPSMSLATSVEVSAGFFSSYCIAQIAPGLASLVDREITLRLLVSPELSLDDLEAIERGLRSPQQVVDDFMIRLFEELPDALTKHTADCLAFLVAKGTLTIRCILMDEGMFHKKIWLFQEDGLTAAVHGSGNMTARGLFVNGEQMSIDRPWRDGHSAEERVRNFVDSFELEWSNQCPGRIAIEPSQLTSLLRQRGQGGTSVPTTADFWDAWQADTERGLEPALPPGVTRPSSSTRLLVPSWLNWTDPPFGHQSRAIEALRVHDFVGLLAIATGGGKTKTALIAACQIQDLKADSLFVLVLVPTKPLATQWAEEVREFGLNPSILTGMTHRQRVAELEVVSSKLRGANPNTVVVISTLALFASDASFRDEVESLSRQSTSLLIADEVHNFGAPGFLGHLPSHFKYRLGLSATPVRQYDVEGTAALFDYFASQGEPAFTFTLREAIASGCLTPYNYILHSVEFACEEMDRYRELTDSLRKAGFAKPDDEDRSLTAQQESLLRERRALVEQAVAKVDCLRRLLGGDNGKVGHTLIYCSAKQVKPPHIGRQIDHVRNLLQDLGISTHMYTSVESARADSKGFLDGFAQGDYQALLAMKVLDEGVDVPAAQRAFLLASSTIEREWVQRRGRILRKSPGKRFADLHDFIVVPPEPFEDDARSLLNGELRRAIHFAEDSRNYYDEGGPLEMIRKIEDQLSGGK